MCSPLFAVAASVGSAALQGVQAASQARAQQSADLYNAQVAQNNAVLASEQRSVALEQGQAQVEQSELQQSQLVGRQKAALGANGVALASGSATDILASSKFLGAQDVNALQANAARAAWGYAVQQSDDLAQSNLDRWRGSVLDPGAAGGMAAGASLLSSASLYAGKGVMPFS